MHTNNATCFLLTDGQNDPIPPAQDGATGRDVNADASDGYAGFMFTKLNAQGVALPPAATEWACIRDNVTDLVWENKTDDGGLYDKDDTFVWYEPDSRLGNGGLPGFQQPSEYDPSRTDQTCYGYVTGIPSSYCNTKAYISRVNQAGRCNSNNWRLPTREELHSLVSYEQSPRIDTQYFPNTVPAYYWTSVPYAYLNKAVWAINFQQGGGSPWEKQYAHAVRLVHN